MALSDTTVKLTDDATTLVYNALGLVPAEQFVEAKEEVIKKLLSLDAAGVKPAPKDVIVAFVNTLDDVAHETESTGFQNVMDIVDKIVNGIANGSATFLSNIVDAIKLKKAAKGL